jgi:hypothetical protein
MLSCVLMLMVFCVVLLILVMLLLSLVLLFGDVPILSLLGRWFLND